MDIYDIIWRWHNKQTITYIAKVSYSSFKRFYRTHCQKQLSSESTCRIETPPGRIVQIDYAKMGLLYDTMRKRNRSVYAFIATLGNSRHKYIEFVYKQDQKSFVRSHVTMMHYSNGVPEIIIIDNLKSGIIKPDLYDPKLNRLYQEMAEYDGCFIDPCRMAKPKDKDKVERDVQTIRQQFRKFKALNTTLDIYQANKLISCWISTGKKIKIINSTVQDRQPANIGKFLFCL
jgi:transposase